ncbi:hypothetical protein HOU03_gp350 [Caulobacter phage CcrSC]|uniref:Uncharacterized protein n=1 Tax=Caulobacter phage CcrSC TaxID=2283272 RepID=A0A385EGB3_9CAUD|nr:hypothetical protein HOU03_gp350 [Caulobacter phage CcrSC]AXQ69918.1 hypothetical protein CcrSC_gp336 [Caulobacter phage CcrSC]
MRVNQRKPSILRWVEDRSGAMGYLGDIYVAHVADYGTGKRYWRTEFAAPGFNRSGKGIGEAYCRRQAEKAIQNWLNAAGLAIKPAVE